MLPAILVVIVGVLSLAFIIMHGRKRLRIAIILALLFGIIGFFLAEPFKQYASVGDDVWGILIGISSGLIAAGLAEVVLMLRGPKKQNESNKNNNVGK